MGAGLWPAFATYHLTKKQIEAEKEINGFTDLLNAHKVSKVDVKEKMNILYSLRINSNNKQYLNFLLNNWEDFTEQLINLLSDKSFYNSESLNKTHIGNTNYSKLRDKHVFADSNSKHNFFANGLEKIFPYIEKDILSKEFLVYILNKIFHTSYQGDFINLYLPKLLYYVQKGVISKTGFENFFKKHDGEKLFFILIGTEHLFSLIEKNVYTLKEIEDFSTNLLSRIPKDGSNQIGFVLADLLKIFMPLLEKKIIELNHFGLFLVTYLIKHKEQHKNYFHAHDFNEEIGKTIPYLEKKVIDLDFLTEFVKLARLETIRPFFSVIDKYLYVVDTKKIDVRVAQNTLINISVNLRKPKKSFMFLNSFKECDFKEIKLFCEQILPEFLNYVYKNIATFEEVERTLIFIEKNYIDKLSYLPKILENLSSKIHSSSDFALIRTELDKI